MQEYGTTSAARKEQRQIHRRLKKDGMCFHTDTEGEEE